MLLECIADGLRGLQYLSEGTRNSLMNKLGGAVKVIAGLQRDTYWGFGNKKASPDE
jgi:hypothetical protein